MQLICPTCGEQVKAENVSVQDMVAVCSACDSVFKFSVAEPKAKRRKVRQPQNLTMTDEDTLHLAYRTNFRLDKNETFITTLIMSGVLSVVTLLMFGKSFDGNLTGFLPFITATITAILYYFLALIVYNKTHIDMDADSIHVSRQPLHTIFDQTRDISLSGITSIYSEETTHSKKEAYDTPRYHVWAEMEDGNRKVVVSDLVEDYAVFIAQRLHEQLDLETDMTISRLADDGQIEHEYIVDDLDESSPPLNQNQNH